ncbi:hypothetical protein CUMW_054580 [Citrus unshiu]|nr:hypothetical protein CUMW_054580 [Citrus unshiu]
MINGGTITAPSAPSGIHATVYKILFPCFGFNVSSGSDISFANLYVPCSNDFGCALTAVTKLKLNMTGVKVSNNAANPFLYLCFSLELSLDRTR